jgi:hypothetical protein
MNRCFYCNYHNYTFDSMDFIAKFSMPEKTFFTHAFERQGLCILLGIG